MIGRTCDGRDGWPLPLSCPALHRLALNDCTVCPSTVQPAPPSCSSTHLDLTLPPCRHVQHAQRSRLHPVCTAVPRPRLGSSQIQPHQRIRAAGGTRAAALLHPPPQPCGSFRRGRPARQQQHALPRGSSSAERFHGMACCPAVRRVTVPVQDSPRRGHVPVDQADDMAAACSSCKAARDTGSRGAGGAVRQPATADPG